METLTSEGERAHSAHHLTRNLAATTTLSTEPLAMDATNLFLLVLSTALFVLLLVALESREFWKNRAESLSAEVDAYNRQAVCEQRNRALWSNAARKNSHQPADHTATPSPRGGESAGAEPALVDFGSVRR